MKANALHFEKINMENDVLRDKGVLRKEDNQINNQINLANIQLSKAKLLSRVSL